MEINDTGYKAMMKYYAAGLKPYMSELAKMADKDMTAIIEDDIKKRAEKIEAAVKGIMKARYGVDYDPEVYKPLVKKHKLALAYDSENTFIGVTSRNRWLYTPDGRVIGKKGDRFLI